MCDHDSYIWWDEGTDPELESVVYLLLDEVTASEGLQFLDQLITQEVMSYTIIDEVNETSLAKLSILFSILFLNLEIILDLFNGV